MIAYSISVGQTCQLFSLIPWARIAILTRFVFPWTCGNFHAFVFVFLDPLPAFVWWKRCALPYLSVPSSLVMLSVWWYSVAARNDFKPSTNSLPSASASLPLHTGWRYSPPSLVKQFPSCVLIAYAPADHLISASYNHVYWLVWWSVRAVVYADSSKEYQPTIWPRDLVHLRLLLTSAGTQQVMITCVIVSACIRAGLLG